MTSDDKVVSLCIVVLVTSSCSIRELAHWHDCMMMDALSHSVWWRWRSSNDSSVGPWEWTDGPIHHRADSALCYSETQRAFILQPLNGKRLCCVGPSSLNKDDMMYQGREADQINSWSGQCINGAGHLYPTLHHPAQRGWVERLCFMSSVSPLDPLFSAPLKGAHWWLSGWLITAVSIWIPLPDMVTNLGKVAISTM